MTLNWGEIPDDLKIDEPYPMRLNARDLVTVAMIINRGIDSHLQAVIADQDGHNITIRDTESMHCFLRRCAESGDEDAESLASDIMSTLGYEWV